MASSFVVGAAAVAGVLGLALLGGPVSTAAPVKRAGLNAAEVPNGWATHVLEAGALCPEIPPAVIAAQIEAESGWNARAVSPVGAQGLAQFMPGTWATRGKDGDGDGVADPFNPADAILSQGHFDCDLAAMFRGLPNVLDLALAAYNAGPGAVQSYGGVPPYAETRAYVDRIKTLAVKYAAPGGVPAGMEGVVAGLDVVPILQEAYVDIRTQWPQITQIGGRRPGDSWGDHRDGTAIDVMVPGDPATGDQVAAYLQANADYYRIKYLIWKQRIWSPARPGDGWRPMEDRGSVTANHYDHVHVSVLP